MTSARPYISLLDSRFRVLLQYRSVALAGVITQLFWGLLRAMIFTGFYESSNAPQPLTMQQTITYIWLGQAFLLVTMFGPDSMIAEAIDRGHVAYELTRPADLYFLWFFRCLAGRLAPLILRATPILLLAGFLFHMQMPVSAMAGVLFFVSIALGVLLATSLVVLITLSLLWTISGQGITALAPPMIFIASGIIVPIPLLPNWLQSILHALPFRGLIDTPFRIYLGDLSGAAAASAIVQQIGWIIALILLGRFILSRGLSRLVVQGG